MAKELGTSAEIRYYSDLEYITILSSNSEVKGTDCRLCQESMYVNFLKKFKSCTRNYNGVSEEDLENIYQQSWLIVLNGIKNKKIFCVTDRVMAYDRNGVPKEIPELDGYFMRIVKNLYLEETRKKNKFIHIEDNFDHVDFEACSDYMSWEEDDDVKRARIVRNCLQSLTTACLDILTKFYYENKSLETILEEREQNSSYDGLKTRKWKCMKITEACVRNEFKKKNLNY